MEKKMRLQKYVNTVLLRLRFEKAIYGLQTGLCIGAILAVVVLGISRLFVLPYYGQIAIFSAALSIITSIVVLVLKRTRALEAVRTLDFYTPHNILITALDVKDDTPLADAIITSAQSKVENAFEHFSQFCFTRD